MATEKAREEAEREAKKLVDDFKFPPIPASRSTKKRSRGRSRRKT